MHGTHNALIIVPLSICAPYVWKDNGGAVITTRYTRCIATPYHVPYCIKLARLRRGTVGWPCCTLGNGRPSCKVFLGRPQGQRRHGRPKLRWQDGVEASAIKAGITDWQTKA